MLGSEQSDLWTTYLTLTMVLTGGFYYFHFKMEDIQSATKDSPPNLNPPPCAPHHGASQESTEWFSECGSWISK